MINQQLLSIISSISCVRHHFIGMFARSDLSENSCVYLIGNKGPFPYLGYWIAVFLLTRYIAELFDILGRHKRFYGQKIR
jgi:hypothetical protein